MKMIIGGAFQGKLRYARKMYPDITWADGKVCSYEEIKTCEGICHLEAYIRRAMQEEEASLYLETLNELAEINPRIVVISDEVGYGLVPADPFERRYRETAGRICTRLAADAAQVDRVVCGIGTTIKKEEPLLDETLRNEVQLAEELGAEKDIPSAEGVVNRVSLEQILPEEIEKRSFEIITEELGDIPLVPGTEAIVKRCIHTSADFEYARNLVFSEQATEKIQKAIREGASIVTDTQMVKAGINKKKLGQYGGKVHCFMSDEDVAKEAKRRGVTRAAVSMEKAAGLHEKLIFAVGNAPTALIRLYELIREENFKPEAIIGVPVGFVNVVQSKERILTLEDIPYIVARGRKGGSNIAACICNALLYTL